MTTVDDIPVAHTPEGGWTEMPRPILDGCNEPLADGAPDLRGTWRTVSATRGGQAVDAGDPILDHVERIEQAADRVVVTSTGVVHDMRADGTEEHGVHDVSAIGGMPIHVVAAFEDGALVLRPVGIPVEVTRHLEGDELVWHYGPDLVVRMVRA